MISLRLASVLVAGCLLLAGCAAHQQAYDRALDYEQNELYYQAALQDLEALDRKPDFAVSLTHLREVAPKAYSEVLGQAEALETAGRWISAVERYLKLQNLLNRAERHGVVVATIDLTERLRQTRERGAAAYFEAGEEYFGDGEYALAIPLFEQVVEVRGVSFGETRQRLWASHMALGADHLGQGEFEAAVTQHEKALEYQDDQPTRQALATVRYDGAAAAFAAEDYRRATEWFEAAVAVVPGFRDAAARGEHSLELAIVDVVVLPFQSHSDHHRGPARLLRELFLDACLELDSRYVYFWHGEALRQLIGDHGSLRSGTLSSQTAASLAERGVDVVVRGSVERIDIRDTAPSFEEHLHELVTEVDSAGTTLEVVDPIFYREYHAARFAQVKAQYSLIDVETGMVLEGPSRFSEDTRSHAHWIRYQGSIYDLPPDRRHLLDGPAEPESAGVLIDELVVEIAQLMRERLANRLR